MKWNLSTNSKSVEYYNVVSVGGSPDKVTAVFDMDPQSGASLKVKKPVTNFDYTRIQLDMIYYNTRVVSYKFSGYDSSSATNYQNVVDLLLEDSCQLECV